MLNVKGQEHMKKNEIRVGGHYTAKVAGKLTTVRVDAIRELCGFGGVNSVYQTLTGRRVRETTMYDVTNLRTGRRTTFRSAAKFRCEVKTMAQVEAEYKQAVLDAPPPFTPKVVDAELASPGHTTALAGAGYTKEPLNCPDCLMTPCECPDEPEGEDSSDPTPASPSSPEPAPSAADQPSSAAAEQTTAGMSTANGLAARIATARTTRTAGMQVAGMVPNDEQEAILAAAAEAGLRVLVISAGAGTGKTATLKMLEQVLPGRGQYTAFNTSLVAESKAKFVKAACNTTHSLAFRAVGKLYQHRLGGESIRSRQVAQILGISDLTVALRGMGEPDAEGKPTDKQKRLSAEFLAGQVLAAVKRFCQSADPEIGAGHLRYIDGIDAPLADGKRGHENNGRVRDHLLPSLAKAWADLGRVDGQMPFAHDVYVKLWQLGTGDDRPIIAADYILLDEAQDTAPVFLSILQQQTHALLVLVGDDNQQIYEWRGAVNAMASFRGAPRRLLSQSYRFGQAVADVANAVLATLDDPTDLVMRGDPSVPSRVAEVAAPRCYLYRTNAGAVARVIAAIREGKRPHLVGGGADVVAWCQAAADLQARRGTNHPELCCFETWAEVVEYSKTDEGGDLRLMVKLVEEFGAANIRDALKNMPREEDADLVVSTAHKSKGREWDTVRLGPDFPLANNMTDADRRLLYVAATRAKLTLDITECPPFCGGRARGGADTGEWVPGIEITYTQPVPGPEAQAAFLAARNGPTPAPATVPAPQPNGVPGPAAANPGAAPAGGFTWARLPGGGWGARGSRDAKIGDRVKVKRRDGSSSLETLSSVVQRYDDAWIYAI